MKNSIIALFLFSFLGSGLMAQSSTNAVVVPGKADTYRQVQDMPEFPGCETMDKNDRITCSRNAMMKYLENHPSRENQQSRGVYGTQVVEFIVQKDGSVSDVSLKRALRDDPEYLTETRDMFLNMPKWKPGMLDGQAVNVLMTVPLSFKL